MKPRTVSRLNLGAAMVAASAMGTVLPVWATVAVAAGLGWLSATADSKFNRLAPVPDLPNMRLRWCPVCGCWPSVKVVGARGESVEAFIGCEACKVAVVCKIELPKSNTPHGVTNSLRHMAIFTAAERYNDPRGRRMQRKQFKQRPKP